MNIVDLCSVLGGNLDFTISLDDPDAMLQEVVTHNNTETGTVLNSRVPFY